jgi:alkyl hydroperoxide reductase subunit AhpC
VLSTYVSDFAERNVKLVGLRCDDGASYARLKVEFPIVDDPLHRITKAYGMTQDGTSTGQTIGDLLVSSLTRAR